MYRRDRSNLPGVVDLLLRAGADVNCRTADLGVTPLTLLLQRAASSSKTIRTCKWNEKHENKNENGRDNGRENENGNENGRENESRRISLGSYISAAHTQTMALMSPHTAQLGSDSDDKTILYADHMKAQNTIGMKISPGLGDNQNGNIDKNKERERERDSGRDVGRERERDRDKEREEKDSTCSLEWAATALHLLRSGTLYLSL